GMQTRPGRHVVSLVGSPAHPGLLHQPLRPLLPGLYTAEQPRPGIGQPADTAELLPPRWPRPARPQQAPRAAPAHGSASTAWSGDRTARPRRAIAGDHVHLLPGRL